MSCEETSDAMSGTTGPDKYISEEDRLRNVLSIVYGLLWRVDTDRDTERGERVFQARWWCTREIDKEKKAFGIGAADNIIYARGTAPPFEPKFSPSETK